ncbi:MAG TPA: PQQ-binding-like beta-propeller repeat protein [bacterium]|nr:PQQ-binding-like beta-propeller repeat protein [bacterium]
MTAGTVRAFGRTIFDLAEAKPRHSLPFLPQSLVQDDEIVCALRGGSSIAAFSLADGTTRWEAQIKGTSRQMTIDGGEVFVATEEALVSFGVRDGARRILWSAGEVDRFAVSREAVAVRLASGDVQMLGRDGRARARVARSSGERLANGVDHLLPGDGEVAAVMLEAMEREFHLRGLDAAGGVAWSRTLEHSEMLSREAASGLYYFLNFEQAGRGNLLFTSHWSTFRRPASQVVRVCDGAKVVDVEHHVSALVERSDGSLAGLLAVDQVKAQLVYFAADAPAAMRWTTRAPSSTHRRADACLTPEGLLVAQYDAILPGARLVLLTADDGLTRWQAEVLERPPFERTPLFVNAWSVTAAGNRVVLVGDESAGTSAQVFDLADGRRLWADLAV